MQPGRVLQVEPVTLGGKFVRLEPLALHHVPALLEVARADYFQFYITLQPREISLAGMEEFVRASLAIPTMQAFVQVIPSTGQVVGMTSYLDIRPEHRALEIGFTWIAEPWQKTAVNPEAKYMLLRHAFETLGCVRVQLKTDSRNAQSIAAMTKLGAVREGTLRRFGIQPNGYVRDTVMFSILPEEWPDVRKRLIARLAAFETAADLREGG
jgi:RimJ/RimL family protein N-acetyltransferase